MNNKITVISFDLSSVCIGVVASIINTTTKEIITVKSCPIIPKIFNPEELGYRKSKKKMPTGKSGEFINSYYKAGEVKVSKVEKKKRDAQVRSKNNLFTLQYIGRQITKIVEVIEPDLIIVEKNEIFNGVLTSVLLGKVMGVLIGIASSKGIIVKDYTVKQVRSIIDIIEATHNLVDNLSEKEILKIPDITKRALRVYMESKYGKYGLECATDDESDACVVFNYWYEKDFKGVTNEHGIYDLFEVSTKG